MVLELKKIKLGIHSEETLDYTATLYIDGKAAAYVSNRGNGGETDVSHISNDKKDLLRQAEEYAKTLPPVTGTFGDLNMTLDFWCDLEAAKEETRKVVLKHQRSNLVIQKGEEISTIAFGNLKIADVVAHPNARIKLKESIARQKADGYTILNTNIPEELL